MIDKTAPTPPVPLFDALFREYRLRSDRALAKFTHSHTSYISRVRSRKLPINDAFLCRVARATGWTLAHIDALVMETPSPQEPLL